MIKLTSLITPNVVGGVVNSKKTVRESEETCPKCGKQLEMCECGMGEDTIPQDTPVNVANGLPHTDSSADTKKYSLTREGLKNIVREVMKEEEEYQKVFHKMLSKFGVNSPADLSDEQKKKFFTMVKGIQTELAERAKIKEAELSAAQKQLDVDKDGDIEGDDLAKLRAGKNEAKKKKW